MTVCPSCGTSNAEAARFCASCGAALTHGCATCGADLAPDARFCSSCGTAVAPASAPAGRERRLVTLLFADVTGSTALGERLDPERMQQVLEVYFAAMRDEIVAEGGTVEKYIGDAIVAAFGVPAAHEDDPSRALRAALRMQARLEDVNAELLAAHDVQIQIRIGVNSGEVLATVDPAPGEPMFTGDAANVAARFEQAAEPGEILASERTARAARGFAFEERGWLDLKGKRDRFRAYRVLRETGGAARGVPGLRSPMIGRDGELGVLRSVYERLATEGRPHLVTIYGDAGVGKSRLAREFREWAEDREPPPLVLVGRCLPYGEGVTYWPLAEILKGHAGVLDTDPPDLTLEKIRKAGRELITEAWAPEPVRATAALAFTLGVEDPEVRLADLDPRDVRAEVHAAWRSFFSALASDGPLLTVVEDIHWAEAPLLDLLEELADRVQGPAMFVCPSRPDLLATRTGWGGGRRNTSSVSLDPLGSEQAEELIRHLLAIDDLPGSVRAAILSRAEGNPFFLEEIIRRLIDEGLVVRAGNRWRATAGVADVDIPDSVQAVLASRVDLLDPQDRRVLQAASVVGRVFWPGPVVALTGLSPGELDDCFRRLEDRELVLSRLGSSLAGQPELIFKHILTRDVAYGSIPRRDRAAAHRTVAEWLEDSAGERAREFVELLAYHYGTAVSLQVEHGEEDDALRAKACRILVQASRDARSREIIAKAMRLADDAVALARTSRERADALEALGEAYKSEFRGDLAWRYLREAALAQQEVTPVDGLRLAHLIASACDLPVRWPGSMRTLAAGEDVRSLWAIGMEHLPPGDSEPRAALLGNRAGWPFAFPEVHSSRELEEAERSGLEAVAIADRLDRPDLASAALDEVQGGVAAMGLYGKALRLHERRAAYLSRLRDTFEIGDFYGMGAWGNYELGRYRASVARSAEAIRFAEGHVANTVVHAVAWQVVARARLGEWDGALEDLRWLRELLDDRRDDPPPFTSHAFASGALIAELRREQSLADELSDVVEHVGADGGARIFAWRVRLLLERGQLAAAEGVLADPPPSWRRHRPDVEESRLEVLAARGSWEGTAAVLAELREYAAEAELEALPAFLDRHEGRAAAAAGDLESAVALLGEAAGSFAALEAGWERARTQRDLARALREAGREAEAQVAAAAARATFTALRSVKDLDAMRDLD